MVVVVMVVVGAVDAVETADLRAALPHLGYSCADAVKAKGGSGRASWC